MNDHCASCDIAEDMLIEWRRNVLLENAACDILEGQRHRVEDIVTRQRLADTLPDGRARSRVLRDIDRLRREDLDTEAVTKAREAFAEHSEAAECFIEAAGMARTCDHVGVLLDGKGWSRRDERWKVPARLVRFDGIDPLLNYASVIEGDPDFAPVQVWPPDLTADRASDSYFGVFVRLLRTVSA